MAVVAVLRRMTAVAKAEEFASRSEAYVSKVRPYLEGQAGFVSHEIRREGEGGEMVEETAWASEEDCRRFIRGGAAATAATWLDGALPTAAYPNGNWERSVVERG